jgi:hypothetical protein
MRRACLAVAAVAFVVSCGSSSRHSTTPSEVDSGAAGDDGSVHGRSDGVGSLVHPKDAGPPTLPSDASVNEPDAGHELRDGGVRKPSARKPTAHKPDAHEPTADEPPSNDPDGDDAGDDTGDDPGDDTGDDDTDGGTHVSMVYPDPRGACTIDSGFPDDHACILPPDPAVGMQIHIGPTDYDDPDQINKFVFHAGQESSECWSFHTPNDEEIAYQTFVISARLGAQRILNTTYTTDFADGGFTACLDPGTGTNTNILGDLPSALKAYTPRGTVAPENAHIGRKVGAHTPAQADMHFANVSHADSLREMWLNIYFVDKAAITERSTLIRGMGGISWVVLPIAAHSESVYAYSCPIDADGRIMRLGGYYHSHGERFSAYVRHGSGPRIKVFEMHDYEEAPVFQYDSITTNPLFSNVASGALSGVLNVKSGDTLDWECHIVNDSDVALTYSNEIETGEMCNLSGESVGPLLNCVLP